MFSTNTMIHSASKLALLKIPRCGIIPYTIVKKQEGYDIKFMLARDAHSKDLGDFGGGVKKGETPLMAGLREFREEARGILGEILKTANDISIHPAVVTDKMAIIFIPIGDRWITEAPKRFKDQDFSSTKKKANEVSEIVWVDECEFKTLVSGKRGCHGTMWNKIRNFFLQSEFYSHGTFSTTLKKIATTSSL